MMSIDVVGPRERARSEGVEMLGDVELLAILLGTGTRGRPALTLAAELLDAAGGLDAMASIGVRGGDLPLGLGDAKLARIEAAIEIGRRTAARAGLARSSVLTSPSDVAAWAAPVLGRLSHEEVWLLALDGRHGLLSARRVAQGGAHGCSTSSRDILRLALRLGAAGFLLVHNHPSGDPSPSPEDVRMTNDLARAAELVGLPLVDHVVVGREKHASLFEMGLLEGTA
jgi:DNA repair protein RadC